MVELSIVLGILTIVFAGIWSAATHARRRASIEQAVNEIWLISQNVRNLYTGQFPAVVPPMATLIAANIFPQSMMNPAGVPVDPWGRPVTVGLFTTAANQHRYFIRYELPLTDVVANIERCVSLAGYFSGNAVEAAQSGGALSVQAAASVAGLAGAPEAVAMTPDALSAALTAGGGCAAIQFTFQL